MGESIYLVDGEGDSGNPVVVQLTVGEQTNGDPVENDYLYNLMQDMIGATGFNMDVTATREGAEQKVQEWTAAIEAKDDED